MAVYTYPYADQAERDALVLANSALEIDGEDNHIDGNWIRFRDPVPFDLTTTELIAILKLIVEQLNVLRTNSAIGLPAITYAQARDAIKAALGK